MSETEIILHVLGLWFAGVVFSSFLITFVNGWGGVSMDEEVAVTFIMAVIWPITLVLLFVMGTYWLVYRLGDLSERAARKIMGKTG